MKDKITPENAVTCPSCKEAVHDENMTHYKGDYICDGCAENRDMLENSDDPCGKNWNP